MRVLRISSNFSPRRSSKKQPLVTSNFILMKFLLGKQIPKNFPSTLNLLFWFEKNSALNTLKSFQQFSQSCCMLEVKQQRKQCALPGLAWIRPRSHFSQSCDSINNLPVSNPKFPSVHRSASPALTALSLLSACPAAGPGPRRRVREHCRESNFQVSTFCCAPEKLTTDGMGQGEGSRVALANCCSSHISPICVEFLIGFPVHHHLDPSNPSIYLPPPLDSPGVCRWADVFRGEGVYSDWMSKKPWLQKGGKVLWRLDLLFATLIGQIFARVSGLSVRRLVWGGGPFKVLSLKLSPHPHHDFHPVVLVLYSLNHHFRFVAETIFPVTLTLILTHFNLL